MLPVVFVMVHPLHVFPKIGLEFSFVEAAAYGTLELRLFSAHVRFVLPQTALPAVPLEASVALVLG